MQLTDTHTHIYYQEPEALKEQMERCFQQQVERLFLANVDVSSMAKIKTTVNAYPEHCFPMLGLHPCSVKENYQDELSRMEAELMQTKVVAIGEIGLDLHWDKTTLELQKDAFRVQVSWAKKLDLPIVIHCRDAFEELFELLEELHDEKLRGILHCFTGTLVQAQRAISLGFYLGIGGVVTFKNSGLDKVVQQLHLKDLVLETDSPYLAPTPHRGKPNESSYLVHIAQKVADLHGVSLAEIAEITTRNSKIVFGI